MNLDEDVYLVDSIPLPICKLTREKQVKICKEQFETSPDKGCSAGQPANTSLSNHKKSKTL